MADEQIKKVRQFCVSVMLLCLVFLGVFEVQERTGLQSANAGSAGGMQDALGEGGQLIQFGEDLPFGGGHAESEVETSAWSQIFGTNLPEILKRQGDTCLLIKKNGFALETIAEEMVYRKVTVAVQGNLTAADVYRVSGDRLYVGVPEVPVVIIPEEEKNVPLVREPKAPGEDLLLSLTFTEKDGKTEAV